MRSKVYQLVTMQTWKKNKAGEENYFDTSELFDTYETAFNALKDEVEIDRIEGESDFRYFIKEIFLNSQFTNGHLWAFDRDGCMFDSTRDREELSSTPRRQFSENQIVAALIRETWMTGVIGASHEVVLPDGSEILFYKIQTPITDKDYESIKEWLPSPYLVALQPSDVEPHRLHWIALELLDEDCLNHLQTRLTHMTTAHYAEVNFQLPEGPRFALLSGKAILSLKSESLRAGGWDKSRSFKKDHGHFTSKKDALVALDALVMKDRNSAWDFSKGIPPAPLTLRYILDIEPLVKDSQKQLAKRDEQSWWYDLDWYFDRRGRFIGQSDFSSRPFLGIHPFELRYRIGDIVALHRRAFDTPGNAEKSCAVLSFGVIVQIPPSPSTVRPDCEQNDALYIIESGVIHSDFESFDTLPEASILPYEHPIDDRLKKRLARVLADEASVKSITDRFHFGVKGTVVIKP